MCKKVSGLNNKAIIDVCCDSQTFSTFVKVKAYDFYSMKLATDVIRQEGCKQARFGVTIQSVRLKWRICRGHPYGSRLLGNPNVYDNHPGLFDSNIVV